MSDDAYHLHTVSAHRVRDFFADAAVWRAMPNRLFTPLLQASYDVELSLFGLELKPSARRFAVAESLSHLDRLVAEGGAVKNGADGPISYTPA